MKRDFQRIGEGNGSKTSNPGILAKLSSAPTSMHSQFRTRFGTRFAPLNSERVNPEDSFDRIEKETWNTLVTLSRTLSVPRRFQWYIAEGMLSLPTAKWSMVISFFSGVMASGFAFGCAKDTVEFFNAGIGEVRFPVGEGFLLVIFDYVGPWV